MQFDDFDWDEGNWPKCRKHGLKKSAIEWVLSGTMTIFDDPFDSTAERRFRAIGEDAEGRCVFVVFCFREQEGKQLIRPISARYMHQKEILDYEQER